MTSGFFSLSLMFVLACLHVMAACGADLVPAGGREVLATDALTSVGAWKHPQATATMADGIARLQVMSTAGASNGWDIQVGVPNAQAIARGDALLAVLELRCTQAKAESGEGHVGVVLEGAKDFAKVIVAEAPAGPQWSVFYARGRAERDYAAGALRLNLRLAYLPQKIELRSIHLLDYGGATKVEDLPIMRVSYAGRESDAPWRKAAAERIEAIRKGDLAVQVVDANGAPVPGAQVHVQMQRHAFPFASAVSTRLIGQVTPDQQMLRQWYPKLFSYVVAGDMKWASWAWGNPANRPAMRQGIQAIREMGYPAMRGHCLVWPGWQYLPADLKAHADDPAYLRNAIAQHIRETAGDPGVEPFIDEWDVVNETVDNRDLQKILGEGEIAEWFRLTHEAAPRARLFINDYSILSGGGAYITHQDEYERIIRMLKDKGAPITGMGFQSHFGQILTPPEQLLRVLDRFGKLGLEMRVTEFDIETDDGQAQADYTRDFLTTIFSHPGVTGFVMWGFWEGDHWLPKAAMLSKDWKLKPNGQAYMDLVMKQWWTDQTVTADAAGRVTVRGFLGDYRITATDGGRSGEAKSVLAKSGSTARVELK